MLGCAKREVSGVLYPKSAYAGLNSLSSSCRKIAQSHQAGRHATDGYEPRQVRKEAAVNNAVCVVEMFRPIIVARVVEWLVQKRVHNRASHQCNIRVPIPNSSLSAFSQASTRISLEIRSF